MKKRFTLTYDQVEKLKNRQSRTLIIIGACLLVLAIIGLSLQAAGMRNTLSTRQTLTSGTAKTLSALKTDRDITTAAEDFLGKLNELALRAANERKQSLENQRAQFVEGSRDYDKFTSRMQEYDAELEAFQKKLSEKYAAGEFSKVESELQKAIEARVNAYTLYETANKEFKLTESNYKKATKAYNNAVKSGSTATEEEIQTLLDEKNAADAARTEAEEKKNLLYQEYSLCDAETRTALAKAAAEIPTVSFIEQLCLFFSSTLAWAAFGILGIELIVNGVLCLKKPKLTPLSVLADILIYDFFIVLGSIMLAPLLYVAIGSFSSTGLAQFRFGKLDFSAYKMIAFSKRTMTSIANSFIITIIGTLINIVITSVTAYALSKRDLPGRNWMMKLVVVFMLFHAGLIPDYILVANTLGLTNTYWAIWLPVIISSSNLIIMKNFFQQLPESIEESARIDGCNEIQSFIHIVIPMSMASIATFSLFYAVGHWNNYQRAMIYITDNNKYPITVLLRQVVILSQGSLADDVLPEVQVWAPTNSVKYATIMVGTVPIICVYPFLQKHFTKGVLLGSVKG